MRSHTFAHDGHKWASRRRPRHTTHWNISLKDSRYPVLCSSVPSPTGRGGDRLAPTLSDIMVTARVAGRLRQHQETQANRFSFFKPCRGPSQRRLGPSCLRGGSECVLACARVFVDGGGAPAKNSKNQQEKKSASHLPYMVRFFCRPFCVSTGAGVGGKLVYTQLSPFHFFHWMGHGTIIIPIVGE